MEWLIQDLGSTNGTFLGEVRVSATTEIHPDDVISMAGTKVEVLKVWDPQLQKTVMMEAPVFETLPSVVAVSRTPVARKLQEEAGGRGRSQWPQCGAGDGAADRQDGAVCE